MIRFFALLLLAFLQPAFISAQTCPCCKKRDAGQVAFARKDYKTALTLWQEGLKLPDAAKCPTLKNLVAKAKSKIDAQPAAEEEPVIMDQSGVHEADLIRFSTAPDKDGDGVADKDDQCPDVTGLIKYNGCPPPIELDAVGLLPEMVLVPGDTFIMGDLFEEGIEDQVPRHEVRLSDFYLGKTEVTFQNFDAFCTATGRMKPSYNNYWDRSQRPVVNIDWYDAVEYCNWLSQQQELKPAYTIDKSQKDPDNYGTDDAKKWIVTRIPEANGYRLPTEAEWEYAAREGGKKLRFGNGKDTANLAQMNFEASAQSKKPYSIVGKRPFNSVECGSLRSPNALGLHDMSGNVREWCADWYGDYLSAPVTNPIGRPKGRLRIERGGSYEDAAHACRTMARIYTTPTSK
jgi:formylglycine-generating enzyme required for sulfatase activity